MAETTKITTLDNGPFLVDGQVMVTDADGNQFDSKGKSIALCRCSASGNSPFCDGSHVKADFQSAPRASV